MVSAFSAKVLELTLISSTAAAAVLDSAFTSSAVLAIWEDNKDRWSEEVANPPAWIRSCLTTKLRSWVIWVKASPKVSASEDKWMGTLKSLAATALAMVAFSERLVTIWFKD